MSVCVSACVCAQLDYNVIWHRFLPLIGQQLPPSLLAKFEVQFEVSNEIVIDIGIHRLYSE